MTVFSTSKRNRLRKDYKEDDANYSKTNGIAVAANDGKQQ